MRIENNALNDLSVGSSGGASSSDGDNRYFGTVNSDRFIISGGEGEIFDFDRGDVLDFSIFADVGTVFVSVTGDDVTLRGSNDIASFDIYFA